MTDELTEARDCAIDGLLRDALMDYQRGAAQSGVAFEVFALRRAWAAWRAMSPLADREIIRERIRRGEPVSLAEGDR